MIWTGATTASAEAETPDAQDTVQAIDALAGTIRSDAVDVSSADMSVTSGGTTVELSPDAADGIAIDGPKGADLGVGLPFADQADAAAIMDGTVVYDNNNGSSTTPLVQDDGSVQILTTIADSGAPTTYEYAFDLEDGASLNLTADGGAIVLGADGISTATVAAPWAYDATGASVPTWYELSGDTLVQHIEHAGAKYPVVADPKLSLGWKIYVKYSNSEVVKMTTGWRGTVADKQKYSAWLCTFLVAGGAVGTAVGAACAYYVYDVTDSVIATAKAAGKKGQCLELQYTYQGVLVGWKGYTC